MYVYIRLTESCNLTCNHCFNNIRTNRVIDFIKLRNVLKKLDNKNNTFIIHGGEPLLVNTRDIINLVKDFPNNRWQITTNLVYDLTEDILELFKLVDEIRISFDIKIRFKDFKNLSKWIKNVKILRKNNIDINLNLCLTEYLVKHNIKSFINFIDILNVKNYRLEIIRHSGNVNNNSDFTIDNDIANQWLLDLYRYNKTDSRCKNINEIKHCISSKDCFYKYCCRDTITINSDLSIRNCPAYNANISPAINKNINKCLACDFYIYCRGWCPKMEWTNHICPFPKELAKEILEGTKK